MLPEQLRQVSVGVRGRMAQLLTVWCGQEPHCQQRLSQVVSWRFGRPRLAMVEGAQGNMVSRSQPCGTKTWVSHS